MMRLHDKDGNGSIDFEEFEKLHIWCVCACHLWWWCSACVWKRGGAGGRAVPTAVVVVVCAHPTRQGTSSP